MENLAEALRYASLGYKLYPVWGIKNGKCLCDGMKGCRPGKHPWGKEVPHGEKDATTDEQAIRRWFKGAAVNVGVSIDGFVVIDFDLKHGGMETLAEWERQYGAMPRTPTVASGGGGRHFYFKHPGVPLIDKPARGVDCLWGNGGGLIMPPSNHKDGGQYQWLVPLETPLADMPTWLVDLVRKIAPLRAEQAEEEQLFNPMDCVVDAVPTFADLGFLPSGSRNASVNSTIGSMLAGGFTQEQIIEDGLRWAEKQEPPYSADNLREKVRFFGGKHEVEIADLKHPHTAPLHQGEVCSPFAVSPVRQFAASPARADEDEAPPTPISRLGDEAYYGIVGDFVRAVEPFTEADTLGILACLLCGVGNALGRSIHHRIGRRHGTNLFVLLTGATSDRKGTCWDVAESLLSLAVPEWSSGCIESGLGSGQGLLYRIRDAQGDDEGVPDKRLLVCEEEWSKPMRLLRSENSILSAMLREAFDGKPLAVLNKGENRYGCREPHITIVGMITPDELLELLKGRSEMHNGFLNRFLLIGVKRTCYLPCGADYGSVCAKFAAPLREAVNRAVVIREPFGVAEEAKSLWDAEYRRLEHERPGNYGKATARLSVHALKVAMLFTALDGENAIGLRHLKAALSFIAHADRTAFNLFGTSAAVASGEESHARLLTYARTRSDGITKTEAHRLFSNKKTGKEIDADFALLTPAFGDWQSGRWFAREFQSDMGGGVADETKVVCEKRIGEEANDTEALGAKEGL